MILVTRLLNWIRRRREAKNRGLFAFYDGRRNRSIDPLEVLSKFEEDPAFVPETHLSLVDAGDFDALAIAVRAIRQAFEIPSVRQGGLSSSECIVLISEFYDYLELLKKNGSGQQITQLPMESRLISPLEDLQKIQEVDALTAINSPMSAS